MRTFIILLAGLYFMLLPMLLDAKVIINEIMYDPEGTDTGREWIEVYNTGTDDVDLATYKLFENNVNHKLTLATDRESIVLKSGEYAILADNPEKFLIDFPGFTDLLFDSAFSLNNTGEILTLNDGAGVTVDHFEYSGELGAGNNSNSLQKTNNGFWIEASPTIASVNKQEAETKEEGGTESNSNSSSTSSTSNSSSHSSQNILTTYVQKSLMEIGLGRNRTSSIHTPLQFKAEFNTNKQPRFIWNFGDGYTDKGVRGEHAYKRSGIYNVVLNGFLDGYQATSRIKVQIQPVSVENMSITSGKHVDILLKNKGASEINVGKFVIEYGVYDFTLPDDTIIDAHSEILIPHELTSFEVSEDLNLSRLLYPNGILLHEESVLIPTSTTDQMI